VFPSGTVWTDVVLGLEPAESTIEGIEALARLGVVPVLAVHHPGRTRFPQVRRTSGEVVARLERAAREQKLVVSWVRDLALGITPLDAFRLAGTTRPQLDGPGAVRCVSAPMPRAALHGSGAGSA
jgi:hypothetical protein